MSGRAGDIIAFEMLLRRYERQMYAFTYRMMGGNAADADDLTQETFILDDRWISADGDAPRFHWMNLPHHPPSPRYDRGRRARGSRLVSRISRRSQRADIFTPVMQVSFGYCGTGFALLYCGRDVRQT